MHNVRVGEIFLRGNLLEKLGPRFALLEGYDIYFIPWKLGSAACML
jgi:hypothetical protein